MLDVRMIISPRVMSAYHMALLPCHFTRRYLLRPLCVLPFFWGSKHKQRKDIFVFVNHKIIVINTNWLKRQQD